MSELSTLRDEERTGGIQMISRAARILNALGERPDGMSLGEIAQAAELPRSTVQRIVAALDSVQLVLSPGPGAGGVRLGPALLRLIATLHTDWWRLPIPGFRRCQMPLVRRFRSPARAGCSWLSCIMSWPTVN